MAMVDLGSFADEKFDPKAWLNDACRSRHSEDPIDSHLNDLEMKLQLMSENIASALEDQSSSSLLKVPRASREVIRLRDDASSLRSTVSSILLKLKQACLSSLNFFLPEFHCRSWLSLKSTNRSALQNCKQLQCNISFIKNIKMDMSYCRSY